MSKLYLFHQKRIQTTVSAIIVFGIILIFKYFYIQVLRANEFTNEIIKKVEYDKTVVGERGRIFDSNGIVLAVNITKGDLWINTNKEFNKSNITYICNRKKVRFQG